MIPVFPWLVIILVLALIWMVINLTSDQIYDKFMAVRERWRREHHRTH